MTKTKEPEAPATSPDLEEIEIAFGALPSDAYIDVYRIDEQNNGKHAFCHRYTDPAEFSPVDLAGRAGAGRYRLYARGKNAKGVDRILKSPTLLIDRSVKPPGGTTGAASSGTPGLSELFSSQLVGQMLSMMQTTQQLNALALKSIAEGGSQESPSDRILAAVLPNLVKPAADPTEIGIKIAALIKGESGGTGGIAKQLGEMLDVVDKVRPFLGDESPRAPAIHPVVEGMRMAEGMLDKYLRIREGAGILSAAPAPAPVTSVAPPVAEPPKKGPPVHPMIGALDRIMPLLVTGARKSADADDYVALVLDQIDVEYHPTLFTTLGNPTVLDELGRRYPDLLSFRPFFAELVRLIRDELGSGETPAAALAPAVPAPSDPLPPAA